jgi:hypothetical protein
MDCQVRAYLSGSPALDRLFVSARAAAYDLDSRSIRLPAACDAAGMPLFVRATRQIGFAKVRVLESAFGADMRPFTRCFEPSDAAVETLLDALGGTPAWDLAEITGLSCEESGRFEEVLASRGMNFTAFPVRARVIDGALSYDDYLATRGPSVNKNQRVHLKRAARDGLTFCTDLEWDAIVRVLDVRQPRVSNGPDYTRTPEFRCFLQRFRDTMAADGRLLEVGLAKDGRLIAYQIAFRSGPVLHMYQTAFDPEFLDYRPGALTLEKAVEHSLTGRPALIDLMNDTCHLAHYSHQVIELERLVFFSHSIKGRMLARVYGLKYGSSRRGAPARR